MKYDHIINHPHHVSSTRKRMSNYDRAAQFSSFKALVGFEDEIDESARFVEETQELSESEREVLNRKLKLIYDAIEKGNHPILKFIYFLTDMRKEGGFYVTMTERVRRIDVTGRKIQLYRTIGQSKSYMELDMDKIKDVFGDLVECID